MGADHPNVATSLNNLVILYEAQGRYSEAEPLYLEAIDILVNTVGVEHPNTKVVKYNYEYLQTQMKKIALRAEGYLQTGTGCRNPPSGSDAEQPHRIRLST